MEAGYVVMFTVRKKKNHPLGWSFHHFKKKRRKERATVACYSARVDSSQVSPRAENKTFLIILGSTGKERHNKKESCFLPSPIVFWTA